MKNKKQSFLSDTNYKKLKQNGFTLIEILLVMGIIAILATIVIVAINPSRQFAQARNSQRVSNVNTILNAIGQNIADNRGVFACAGAGAIPQTATVIKSVTGGGGGGAGFDIAACLSPTYVSSIPVDPSAPNAHFTSNTDYDTEYSIIQDPVTKRVTVSAPFALDVGELAQTISVTR